MGISGLLPLLKSIHKTVHLRDFAGQTVGVDAYVWLHKGAIACAVELALDEPTTKYVDYAMHRVRMFKHFGVTPYLVFDGDYLPSKASTEASRESKRNASKAAGLELLKLGKKSAAFSELQKAIDVTPAMACALIQACKAIGVSCVVAPYEADAQLYYLEKIGIVDAIVSEDSDLLAFGVKTLLTKMDQYGEFVEIRRERFTACTDASFAGWTDKEFRHMCILSGCDYLDNMPGLGLKTAHRLLRRHKQVERVIQSLRFDKNIRVPANYMDAFILADLTFQHQRVFCPLAEKLVMCNEPENELSDEALVRIGPDLDADIACAIATGELDPISKRPPVLLAKPKKLDSNARGVGSWVRPPRAGPSKAAPKGTKSIASFFKPTSTPSRTPLAPKTINRGSQKQQPLPTPSSTFCVKEKVEIKETVSVQTKRQRLVDETVFEKTGERSSFFPAKRKRSRSPLRQLQEPNQAFPDKENCQLPTPPATLPRKDSSELDTDTPASVSSTISCSPIETPTPAPNPGRLTMLSDSSEKVTKGWLDTYKFKPTNQRSKIPIPTLRSFESSSSALSSTPIDRPRSSRSTRNIDDWPEIFDKKNTARKEAPARGERDRWLDFDDIKPAAGKKTTSEGSGLFDRFAFAG